MADSLITPETNPEEPTLDPNKNYLEELVGDGKKFKTVEDLAKGKYHADQTVESMKRRLDEITAQALKYREENVAKAKLEELIDKLSTAQRGNPESDETKAMEQPTLKPEELKSLIATEIRQTRQAEREAQNLSTAQAKLKERFGDNYSTSFKKQIDELGLTVEYADNLAKTSPKAFERTFGLDAQKEPEVFQSPYQSRQRSDNFAPKGATKRTWSYYQDIFKKDPSKNFDRAIAIQMDKDAIEQGEAFFDDNQGLQR